ncbi:hypothetical protein AVEN_210226-1 [Araneus ventricosus]|uniref:Uncharacterized protein n=1 Tax=Araneus ventricosus TaxID=182803 RepID=A0A4Y2G0Q9_ARAVE|nr:hypothetical protein AVEN_210226-1 [Araneus ventricosus]
MLLFHVSGAKSFEELRTYENVMMDNIKEACRARNLLEDDVQQSVNLAMHNIAVHLHVHNMTLTSIGLPEPATSHTYVNIDFCNLETERKEGERLIAMLNPELRTMFDAVMNAIRGVDEI